MDISLSQELEEYVRSHVEAGNYGNSSEMVCDALKLMQEQHERTIENLRQKLIEAEQGGVDEGFSFEKLNTEIDEEMAAERKRA